MTATRRALLARAAAVALGLVAGCGGRDARAPTIRLATTTSARDTGLLDVLLPAFRAETGVEVQSVAVGTGEALRLGERGDADVVLVHARRAEDEFLAKGSGVLRRDVWWNRFVLYGPAADPAGVRGKTAAEALATVRDARAAFVSRGDDSGTHKREKDLWGGAFPRWDGYLEAGQGMSPTFRIADEKRAYVLADEGTYLRLQKTLALVPLVADDPALRNPYGAILVRESPGGAERHAAARRLVEWLAGPRARELVRGFVIDGRRAFFLPDERPPVGG